MFCCCCAQPCNGGEPAVEFHLETQPPPAYGSAPTPEIGLLAKSRSSNVFVLSTVALACWTPVFAARFPRMPRTVMMSPVVRPCASRVVITIGDVFVALTMCGIGSQ